jgi:predicted ester cyclase
MSQERVVVLRDWLASNRNAFPNLHFKIESQIVEEDMVVTPWKLTKTHEGEFMGVAATGKEFSIPGVSVTHAEVGLNYLDSRARCLHGVTAALTG